jgi:hypothetical protein
MHPCGNCGCRATSKALRLSQKPDAGTPEHVLLVGEWERDEARGKSVGLLTKMLGIEFFQALKIKDDLLTACRWGVMFIST